MERIIYISLMVILTIALLLVWIPSLSHKLSTEITASNLTLLLSGVPKPSVCIIGSLSNPYMADLINGLRSVGVPYVVSADALGNASCDMLVIESDLIGMYGSYYRQVVINYLSRGVPVEVIGPNAGNELLDLIYDYVGKKATIVIGEPGPSGTLIPKLQGNITAIAIIMVPERNASRYVTGWDIYEGLAPINASYTVLKTWRDYNNMLMDMNSELSAFTPDIPGAILQGSEASVTVYVRGFTYVGFIDVYTLSTYDWYGFLTGEQEVLVKFYYTYQQYPGPYWWFLNVIQHTLVGYYAPFSGLFVPCSAHEAVNGYSINRPWQVEWGADPVGASLGTQSFSYILGGGPWGTYVQVSETVSEGSIGWGYTGDPVQGVDSWSWTFNGAWSGASYEVVPVDIFMINPSGRPPLYESFSFSATFGNWLGCWNSPQPINVAVYVYTNGVTVTS